MKIVWAFTGAGHLLRESVEVFEIVANNHDITVFLSGAGEDVLKMYGLYNKVVKLANGNLSNDRNQKFGFPATGKLSLGKYDLLIVSPATANTVAKIVSGISDSLVTNAVAQAGKGAVKTLIVPVDFNSGPVDTILPSTLNKSKCNLCDECIPSNNCSKDAIISGNKINLLKCIGCGVCKGLCPNDAISEGEIFTMYMRDIDIENTRKLKEIDDISIFENPSEILEFLSVY